MLKYLRIAVTALSLTACVLLIALWVRSYYWRGMSTTVLTTRIPSMQQGRLVYNDIQRRITEDVPDPLVNRYLPRSISFSHNGFTVRSNNAVIPTWALILPIATIAVVPWIPRRFSLRTLLIVMTLVAVGLGMILATN